MFKTKVVVIVCALIVLGVIATFAEASQPATPTVSFYHQRNGAPLPPTISGVVTGDNGPVAGAIVQIQGLPTQVRTNDHGAYTFTGLTGNGPIAVTAWATGHWIGFVTADPGAPDWKDGTPINIALKQLPQRDNSAYEWYTAENVHGSAACGLCHREYKEWQVDA